MRNTWSFQRTITTAGLVLLGLSLLVIAFNLIHPVVEGEALRGPWMLLKLFFAAVLLVSWVLLNVPQPKPPTGQFVLAVAEFGELQPSGAGWQIVAGQRSNWDQLRALLPATTLLPRNLPGRLTAPDRPWARVGSGTAGNAPAPPRESGGSTSAAIHRPPLRSGPPAAGGSITLTLTRPPAALALPDSEEDASADRPPPAPRPRLMPLRAPGATEWLHSTLSTRWADTGATGIVSTVVEFAPDAATARTVAAAAKADAALWGVIRGGGDPALWTYVELLTNLEARAQTEQAELRLAGLSAFPLGPMAPRNPEIILSMLTGLAYYASRLYRQALNEWNLALITAIIAHDNPPETPLSAVAVTHFYRGNALFLLNDLPAAAHAYEQAIAAAPRLAEAQHNLGLVYHAQGRLDKAHDRIAEALKLNPKLEQGRYNLGVVLLSEGQLEPAADIFRDLLARDPANAEAHRALGLVYRGAGRPADAEQELQEALRLRPGYVEVHTDLAALYNQLAGAYPDEEHTRERAELQAKARTELQRAIEIRPDNPDARYNYALMLNAAEQIDAAADEFKEALRLRPDFPEAHYALGVLYKSRGQLDQAVAQFKDATALKPANAETFINLGLVEYGEQRYEEAAEKFRQALRLEPNDTEAHYRLGMALARLNEA
ncbi:MAG TPA: tetratricopeptide repeat protein, partial [Chloroflexia bacterium]|nr:tetratricopeptide repeat protein [Chloroflexia bacterium]